LIIDNANSNIKVILPLHDIKYSLTFITHFIGFFEILMFFGYVTV